jgi:hypothetical protein
VIISGPVPPHLRLYIPHVADSYGGRLYFVLGPGLGDTVNDLRILHEVITLYPKAEPVVYVDTRWRAMCEEIPDFVGFTVRYHAEAPSPMSNGRKNVRPYHQTFRAIIDEITAESTGSAGLVAIGGFKCADRLAKKELNIQMKARAIGLSLPSDRCRPLFPLTERSLERSGQFLKKCGIRPAHYVVVAPYTATDKMWSHEAWESLMTLVHQSTGLSVLVVGDQRSQPFKGVSVHEAIGLPLTLIAGLLAQTRCFIGLDSGPTHLAACFDVPIVTLNPQGKFPPFLVEAHSPRRWTHLTPGVYGHRPIMVQSVMEIFQKALTSSTPAGCPLCSGFPYVLGAKAGRVLYLCRCGLIYRDTQDIRTESTAILAMTGEIPLPISRGALTSLRNSLAIERERNLRLANGGSITVTFDHWSALELEPETLLTASQPRDLWWSWDAAYSFLNKQGWRVTESTISGPASNSGALFSAVVTATCHPPAEDVDLRIPWGRKILDVKRSIYEQWLPWETFQNLDELEGLGWHLANEGRLREGREILRLAFALGRRPRTVERLFRVECRNLWHSLVRAG